MADIYDSVLWPNNNEWLTKQKHIMVYSEMWGGKEVDDGKYFIEQAYTAKPISVSNT